MKNLIPVFFVGLLFLAGCERATDTQPAEDAASAAQDAPRQAPQPATADRAEPDLPPEAAAIRGPQIDLAELEALKDVVATVFGKGKYVNTAGLEVAFSFDANLHEDGRGSGEFHHVSKSDAGTVDLRGPITCLAIDEQERRAWMGGSLSSNASTHPDYAEDRFGTDAPVRFRILESAEGPESPGLISDLDVGGAAAADFCAGKAWPAGEPGGNKLLEGLVVVFP